MVQLLGWLTLCSPATRFQAAAQLDDASQQNNNAVTLRAVWLWVYADVHFSQEPEVQEHMQAECSVNLYVRKKK